MIPERYRAQVARLNMTEDILRDEFGIEPKTELEWDVLMTATARWVPSPLPLPYAAAELDLFAEGFWTIEKSAEHLGLHRSTIYRAIKRGELPYYKMGKSSRIPIKALRIWTEAY